jgi:hypothetical protein
MYYFLWLSKKMDIYSLIRALEILDKHSRFGIQIPPELREILDRTNQAIDAFLQASQEEFDSKEIDSSLEQMLLFLWIVFFKNVLEKNDEYYQKFELYGTPLFIEKDYGKTVVATDIKEKIRVIHELLIESWPHMVPPRIEDINFPDSHLKNDMIHGSASEYRKEQIEPKYGFVKPPSLKPDAQPLSIEDYLKNEYNFHDERCIKDRKVLDIANFIRDPENAFYDPLEFDPTFLSDVVKKHCSKRYLDVYRMFPSWLSDYHPK